MKVSDSGYVILICGGSSSGKTSTAQYLKKIIEKPKLFHLDFDDQFLKACNIKFSGDMPKALDFVIENLPNAARKSSFFMDHWMPPRYEHKARAGLKSFKTFYVWMYCSSQKELMRREQKRASKGEYRGDGVTAAGAKKPKTIIYDYEIDTFGKSPKEIAKLIHENAKKHWGLQ